MCSLRILNNTPFYAAWNTNYHICNCKGQLPGTIIGDSVSITSFPPASVQKNHTKTNWKQSGKEEWKGNPRWVITAAWTAQGEKNAEQKYNLQHVISRATPTDSGKECFGAWGSGDGRIKAWPERLGTATLRGRTWANTKDGAVAEDPGKLVSTKQFWHTTDSERDRERERERVDRTKERACTKAARMTRRRRQLPAGLTHTRSTAVVYTMWSLTER